MKKLILLFVLIGFFTSCGPRRLSCGPRGICETKLEKESYKKNS
jgi:hypothetical protein